MSSVTEDKSPIENFGNDVFPSARHISDACCLASGADALLFMRALFEHSELVRLLRFASDPS